MDSQRKKNNFILSLGDLRSGYPERAKNMQWFGMVLTQENHFWLRSLLLNSAEVVNIERIAI